MITLKLNPFQSVKREEEEEMIYIHSISIVCVEYCS